MAVGANAGHRFLADVAALREADRLLRSSHFLGEVAIVDVQPVDRRARLNAECVVGL
jgi:hypothetical protein